MDRLIDRIDHMTCEGSVLTFSDPEFADGRLVAVTVAGPIEGLFVAASRDGFDDQWLREPTSDERCTVREVVHGKELESVVEGRVLDVASRMAALTGVVVAGETRMSIRGGVATVTWPDGLSLTVSPD